MIKKILVILTFITLSCQVSAKDIYVSLQGNDSWSGNYSEPNASLSDGPFKSLTKAQEFIRQIKNAHDNITVYIRGGTYQLKKTLLFDNRDSGKTNAPITWSAYQNEVVIISGGRSFNSCTKQSNSIISCNMDGYQVEKLEPIPNSRRRGDKTQFQLFGEGKRLTLARWPNNSWAYIGHPFGNDARNRFVSIKALPKNSIYNQDMQVHIYAGNDWYDEYIGIKSLNSQTNTVELNDDTSYSLRKGRRFYISNIASELDEDGEWYYDRNNNTINIFIGHKQYENGYTLSYLKSILQMKKTKNITFKKISFSYARSAAIIIQNSNKVVLDSVTVSKVDSWAVEVSKSAEVLVLNSKVYDVGEGGIMMAGGNRQSLDSAKHVISNTHIHDIGKVVKNSRPAIRIEGVGITVKNNLIHTAPSNGIIFKGNEHHILNNELYDLCQEASDCGAIYTGRDWTFHGNVIENNWIHDIAGWRLNKANLKNGKVEYTYGGARGIYLDDAVSGIKISKNLIHDVNGILVQIGGGRNNLVENNVLIATNGYALLIDNRWPNYNWKGHMIPKLNKVPYRGSTWRKKYPALSKPMNNYMWPEGNNIQKNIIVKNVKNSALVLRYFVPKESNTFKKNILWNTNHSNSVEYKVLDSNDKTNNIINFSEWIKKDIEIQSFNKDPCLVIKERELYSSCEKKLIHNLGIKLPQLENVGLN